MNSYRENVHAIIQELLEPHAPVDDALDFGSGDGWFAQTSIDTGVARRVVAVDVRRRERSFVEPLVYDGMTLPLADSSFDLCYAIDVLHHCTDPRNQLHELARCSRRLLLIKDHNCCTVLGRAALSAVDRLSNWRHGVACPCNHQRQWEWLSWIRDEGFILQRLVYPANCHARRWDRWLDRFEFVGLWQREH